MGSLVTFVILTSSQRHPSMLSGASLPREAHCQANSRPPTCQMLSAGIASPLWPHSLAEESHPTSGSTCAGVSPPASVLETSAPMLQHPKLFSLEAWSSCLVRSFPFYLMHKQETKVVSVSIWHVIFSVRPEYTEQAFLLRTEGSRVLLVCEQPLLRDA